MSPRRCAALVSGCIVIALVGACGGGDGAGEATSNEDDGGTTAARTVFVSSTTSTGALGGLAAADARCQALASAAGLRGTFKAWLGDSSASAGERLAHSTGPYVRTDGVQVAESWADLVTPPLAHPIDVDEHGATLPPGGDLFSTVYVWTGTLPDGRSVGPWNCDAWTSAGGREFKDNGIVGNAHDPADWSAVPAAPAEVMTLGCESDFRLYCFQQ
jgi:hypothetical protein